MASPTVYNLFESEDFFLAPDSPATSSSAGGGKFFDGFSVGASAGVGLFHGSLADYDMFAPFEDFNTYYKFAWRAYAQRDIKWGLGIKLQFEKGQLGGGRLPGLQSLPVTFESKYNTLGLVIDFDILNALLGSKKELNAQKFFLNAELGIGYIWFRAATYWDAEDGRVRDYVGYTVTDPEAPTQRYLLDSKTKPATTFNVPVGFTFGYRINYATDITFSYTLNNTSTKRLDAWARDFNSNDKYSYFGIGLRYNFNRTSDQYPAKKVKKSAENAENGTGMPLPAGANLQKDGSQPNNVDLGKPVQSRKAMTVEGANKAESMDEARRQMFELQLKLFEMQYLLNNPGGTAPK